ncbi:MAG: hypothetical protein HY320_06850 [Armatimonadetes bacterium]|nr:hypothetical protein [Armatimonadota bacterium]
MAFLFGRQRTSALEGAATPQAAGKRLSGGGISWRAILIGLILIPFNTWWVIYVEGIRHWNHATAMSLFWNTVFCLLILVLLNLLLKRYLPRWAFNQGELLTIYVMITLATALAGHDTLQLGYPATYYPFANQEVVKSKTHFVDYFPKHLTIRDEAIWKSLNYGGDTFYRSEYLRAWLPVVLWWSAFITAVGLVMICLNVLIRKEWTENEKLSYPIVQLPLAMTHQGGTSAFFRHKPLWIGFCAGLSVDLINGLAYWYPFLPRLVVRHDAPELNVGQMFATFPWTAISRGLGLPLYPFIIALGYFLPLDLSFSIWFFFLLRMAMRVASAALGFQPNQPKNPPFQSEQSWGAWFAIFLYAIWISRRHFVLVFRRVFRLGRGLDDSREPMSYRAALLGIIAGLIFLTWFCLQAGMTLFIVLLYFLIVFMLSIAITRVRAELGPPAHEMAGSMNAPALLFWMFGTTGVGPANLTMMTMFWWLSGRGYRTNPMPCQLEAFKMAEAGHVDMRGLGWVMVLAFFVGALATYWSCLHWEYQFGANAMTAHNRGQYQLLQSRLENPQPTDWISLQAVGFGLGVTLMLIWARIRFLWWPFHPAGYALAMNSGVEYFWSCLIISSALKWAALRYGGHRLNRQAMPLMFGIILGEYTMGAFWSILSTITGNRTYDFAPG